MDVLTFRATSLQEALEQVRVSLGPDAAILSTRSIKRGRLGLFGPQEIEVDASLGEGLVQGSNPGKTSAPTTTAVSESLTVAAPVAPNPVESATPVAELLAEMMVEFGVDSQLAVRYLQQAGHKLDKHHQSDTRAFAASIQACVASQLKIVEPVPILSESQTVIALIGATGSGKTTVAAKLACQLQATGARVGLVALDMVHIGAVDHLLEHAESLDLPLEVISSASQLAPALRRLRDCNVVLIDTAGRPLDEQQQVFDLQETLQAIGPSSKLLCVSAANSVWHVRASWQRFEVLAPYGLVITRMDESVGLGAWLSLLADTQLPVAYCAQGQAIRQGLQAANASHLAEKLLPFSLNRTEKH